MKRNGLEALNFQHKTNYNKSTNFKYTTETIMFIHDVSCSMVKLMEII
jgi:hypothetical protein